MLASLLARHSGQGHREVDRYAAWLAALQQLQDNWNGGVRPAVRQLRDYLEGVPEQQRAEALQDLIAEHLRLTWEAGEGLRLDANFAEFGNEFAELASPAVVPAELVEDEFLARYRLPHGDTPSPLEYEQRFPARPDVTELLARRCLDGGRFVKLHKRGLGAFGEVWEAHDHGSPRPRSADFQSAVSQGFQPASVVDSRARPEIGDTGGWKPALLGRRVAIKEPRASLTDKAEALRRFAEEARVTAGLEHPGIAALCEHQSSDGSAPIYLMRLANGRTFAERIRDFHLPPVGRTPHEQRLLWNELVQSFVKICEAAVHAHARGVLHRDLKPGNVVVEEAGDPVILDWGMAKHASMCGASLDAVAGTPDYMPPEQADGFADIRSDVFGLGAILYEVLTGRSPHGWSDGSRPADWLRIVREARFQSPRQLRPQTPRVLEAICLKALAREPEGRYQTVAELGEDVRRYLAGEPVSAWKEPVWVRAWLWLRSLGTRSASLAQKPQ